jgi:hypothetical protein
MAKRLTDTDKWKKPFIKELPVEYKLFWLYILDDCDHAGVWQVDVEVAEIRLGTKLSIQKAQGYFKKNIVVLDSGTKWFIPDFISFQYGAFNEENKMFKSIMPILNKYNLIPHLSPIYPPIVYVKDKVMVKDKEDFLSNQKWKEQFCMAKGISIQDLEAIQQDFIHKTELSGKTVDSYKAYFVNWYEKTLPKPKHKRHEADKKRNLE